MMFSESLDDSLASDFRKVVVWGPLFGSQSGNQFSQSGKKFASVRRYEKQKNPLLPLFLLLLSPFFARAQRAKIFDLASFKLKTRLTGDVSLP